MPANLTPQYSKAEEEYRRAQTILEQIACLEKMLMLVPKHKGTEKIQADLKTKLKEGREELAAEKKAPKKGKSYKFPRQGAGQIVVLGGPNAGKSMVLAALTNAQPEVAPYPFTTREPFPAMMPWEDATVQLIDTPPITDDIFEPYMQGLIRGADVVLLLVDLDSDDGWDQAHTVVRRLNETKTRLARESALDEEDVGLSFTQTLLVPNKIDTPDAEARLEMFRELQPLDFPEHIISAETGAGLEALRTAIFQSLDVVRVYSKNPKAKEADFERPFTVKRGRTVLDVAELIHKDMAATFKFARMWGHGVHDGTPVKGDHVVHDRDIAEIHA